MFAHGTHTAEACRRGDVLALEQLLTAGPIDGPVAESPTSLLSLAAAGTAQGAEGVVAFLLARGAAADALDSSGRTPLHWAMVAHASQDAADDRALAVIDRLQAALPFERRWPRTGAGLPFLHAAAGRNSIGLVRALLARGVPLEETDADGNTALHFCYRWQQAKAGAALLPLWPEPPLNHARMLPEDVLWKEVRRGTLSRTQAEQFLLEILLAPDRTAMPTGRKRF